jgi:hypothetical protein
MIGGLRKELFGHQSPTTSPPNDSDTTRPPATQAWAAIRLHDVKFSKLGMSNEVTVHPRGASSSTWASVRLVEGALKWSWSGSFRPAAPTQTDFCSSTPQPWGSHTPLFHLRNSLRSEQILHKRNHLFSLPLRMSRALLGLCKQQQTDFGETRQSRCVRGIRCGRSWVHEARREAPRVDTDRLHQRPNAPREPQLCSEQHPFSIIARWEQKYSTTECGARTHDHAMNIHRI